MVTKNEPVLYYLDGKFAPTRGFVREELMLVDLEKLQYPTQSILEENTRSKSVNFIRVIIKAYAERRGGVCLGKTGYINGFNVYLWTCENGPHQWYAPYKIQKQKFEWCPVCPHTRERSCRYIFEDLLGKKF